MRRFVSCAADNGIDVFRLHDPLNDVSNLREAGEAIVGAGKVFHAGLVYSPGRSGEIEALVEQAKRIPELGATRVIVNDPTGALLPHLTQELVERLMETTGLPVGLYVQGAAGTGLANALVATRVGADLVATAVYPLALTLHRVAASRSSRRSTDSGARPASSSAPLWKAADVDRRAHRRRARRSRRRRGSPCAPPSTTSPPASSPRSTSTCAPTPPAIACSTRSGRSATMRAEAGWPPLAAPIGQILASQALLNVLSARRYGTVLDEFRLLVEGGYGDDAGARSTEAVRRAVELLGADAPALDDDPPSAEDVREAAEGLAAVEEDLVLLAMFGDEAEDAAARRSASGTPARPRCSWATSTRPRAERIRELVKIVQESGVGEIEIEDEGMRVSVRRADEPCDGRGCAARRPAGRCGAASSPRRRRTAAIRSRVADGRRLLPCAAARRARRSSRSATSSSRGRRCACSRR